MTYRLCDHTTADDANRYRPQAELKAAEHAEPISRLRRYLTTQEEEARRRGGEEARRRREGEEARRRRGEERNRRRRGGEEARRRGRATEANQKTESSSKHDDNVVDAEVNSHTSLVGAERFQLSCQIGIALISEGSQNSQEVLSRAHSACACCARR
mmetsp:Transcript_20661/g.51643  ORF Transcript_20661/g.51643 Transcript_20661/m.51643 type:complete len:157 (+) Transcript_20661:291-761(+)